MKLEVITESDLNYLSPCPDSILQNLSTDSISVKCNIMLKKFNLLPFEQYVFGNIISTQMKVQQLKNKLEEKQKWITSNSQYLFNIQNFFKLVAVSINHKCHFEFIEK